MRQPIFISFAAVVTAVSLAGCASMDGALPTTTASLPAKEQAATKQLAQRTLECRQLKEKITALKADGTVGRVEKAATGKTTVVRIKRASLSKVAELNAANAAYQKKCSLLPAEAPKPAPAVKTAAKTADTKATAATTQTTQTTAKK